MNARRAARRAVRRGDVAAAHALAGIGAPGVQALVDACRGRRRRAAALMVHEAFEELARNGRLPSLGGLRISDACLAGLLLDRHAIVRSVAARMAGYLGNPRAAVAVIQMLRGEADAFVRCRAADALGQLAASEAVPLLARVVEDSSDPARYHALRALGRLGPDACTHLRALAVEHPEEVVRREAAETIARVGDSGAWDALVRSLDDATSCDVRRSVVEGLGRSRAPRAALPLVRLLAHDRSPAVRESAADALAMVGDLTTNGALLDCARGDAFVVEEADPGSGAPPRLRYPVREAAAEALVRLGVVERCEIPGDPPEGTSAGPLFGSEETAPGCAESGK